MKQFKYIVLTAAMLAVFSISAQQKLEKISKSIKVSKDVTIDLNTSYTNIEIDTWDKDVLEVQAFIESDKLSKTELQEALKAWDINVEGSGQNVTITTQGHYNFSWDFNFVNGEAFEALQDLQIELADMPEMPEMPEIPEMPEMDFDFPEMPELPELPELPEGVHDVNFDTEAYKVQGEKYLEKWSKEYEQKYGKAYKDKMKAWAKEFSKADFDKYAKEMEKWGEKFGKNFGEKFGEDMEKWGENFSKNFEEGDWAKKMEKWGEEFGEKFGEKFEKDFGAKFEKEMEEHAKVLEKKLKDHSKHKVKKTLKIKMPKKARLNMNVRHGELKFAAAVYNLKAILSHASLLADSIDGSSTSINASYSPVLVKYWDAGELHLNYVEDARIQHVKTLVLGSKSSNIDIDNLSGNAIIDGSFGDLTISNIANTFNNLNIFLENSDALISLPKIAYSLQYKGNRSELKHPDKNIDMKSTSFSTGDVSAGKTIVVNAKYSEVVMQ